jgi:hypothetical protein
LQWKFFLQRGAAEMKKIETESATLRCGMASCGWRVNNSNTQTSRTCVLKHIANNSCQSSIDIICEHAAQGNATINININLNYSRRIFAQKPFATHQQYKQ